MNIIPYNDNVLVELQNTYKKVLTAQTRIAETTNHGLCVAVSETLLIGKYRGKPVHPLLNKVVYYDEFEDTTSYKADGKKYALIPVQNIRGYEK